MPASRVARGQRTQAQFPERVDAQDEDLKPAAVGERDLFASACELSRLPSSDTRMRASSLGGTARVSTMTTGFATRVMTSSAVRPAG